MPSPVVAYSLMITWPDCSPPEAVAGDPHRLEHVAVADLGLADADAGGLIACTKPRLLITVATTVFLGRWPVSAIPIARIAMIWSPSTSLPVVVDRQAAVGVAVEREAGIGAVLEHRGLQRPRWVEPQPSLMLRPSGSALIAITSAPAARSAAGPASYAAPWAQSRTTLMPSSGRARVPTRCVDVLLRPASRTA